MSSASKRWLVGRFERPGSSQSLSTVNVVVGYLIYYGLMLLALSMLLLPVIIVVGISLNPGQAEVFPPKGISPRWYLEFLSHDRFFSAFFFVSIPIAIVSGLIATLFGVMAAYTLVFGDISFETEVQTYLTTPLIFPSVILGLSLFLFLAFLDIDLAVIKLVFGHVLVALPFTTLLAASTLYSIDRDLELAARNLGASKFQAFRKVTLPLIKSGVVSGFLFAFLISFTDINMALFLSGQSTTTLPLEIFLFLRWESSPIIAAVATASVALVLVLVLLLGHFIGFRAVVEETR